MLNWSNTPVIARLKLTKSRKVAEKIAHSSSFVRTLSKTNPTLRSIRNGETYQLSGSSVGDLFQKHCNALSYCKRMFIKKKQFICWPSLSLILIEFTPDIPQAV